MKKVLIIAFVLFSCCIVCKSQSYTQYLGPVKMYIDPMWGGVYYAGDVSSIETVYGEYTTADLLWSISEGDLYCSRSSHGDYVEFKYAKYVNDGYSVSNAMRFYAKNYGMCCFTIGNGSLCLVNANEDTVLTVIDDNFHLGNDFSILVIDKSSMYNTDKMYEPSIYVVNNGYVKYYENISWFVTSVNSAKMNAPEGGKQFSLEGIEVNEQHKGVIIDNGKKIINK